ncbi:hypothetical protein [Mycolicibacterium monacense]|uniref:Uncharacterized protein n=4 Tax=Mycobacteriaceae TaxID=1762 RepID=A0AAD1MXY1_MYCMB|nr:hypothetical protein [Mycolicibacterium monacense]MDA4101142.1 hypothetical protein [Mycolicibacterium monacense DSM 44395]OBB58459.1 hypothetical protein A6B34_04575 [Mycolicibacterium monacense]OBF57878.1 hypothetical protein A5778_04730 [Mycolicibacterium monacense]ORB13379.1 hypothetical protein BST34_25140 [Mycolicibacterium monacense DSM 44395]QHP87904.1 hypothetical protein EWR22_22540 [Mycolicibacterium monacense DSM 44395]
MRTKWALAASAAVCGVIAAPAGLASADDSAQDTINRLQREGYTVNIDRVGSAPLSECVVTNVRNPRTVTSFSPIDRIGIDDDYNINAFNPIVVGRSVSVTLNCTA